MIILSSTKTAEIQQSLPVTTFQTMTTKQWLFVVILAELKNNDNHVAPNQVKDATDEDFENVFQRAAFFQKLLKNFLEVARS